MLEHSWAHAWRDLKNLKKLITNLSRMVQSLGQRSNCCRSRKCIRWLIPVHAIFAVFYLFFLPVLSRSSFTSRTPNKDQKTEQLFYFLLVQVPSPGDIHELRGKRFCACYSQALTKSASRKKWHVLVPLDGFPWFKHHSIALLLLYNIRLERSFSIERFQSYTASKNWKISVQPRGILHVF